MPDLGERLTEADFQRLKAKIKEVYTQAYEDIYKKNLDFVRRHEKREAMYRQQLADGKISKADFDAWMRGQVFQGKQWEAKRKQMRETLLNADKIAMDMVNDSRYSVFATNANYIGYELEKELGAMTSFGLYDANSVARLLKEEPDLLPPRKVGRDDSYKWYNRQIQTAITQGIIQGERIDEIAKRIAAKTGETNMKAMIRNARTMHTGAQNAGRMEGLHQAQRLGIKVKKRWMATLDGRTRDSHRSLDGQVQEVDDMFISELGKLMFPGDAVHGKPGDIWNCRCTMTYVYPEYPSEMQRRDGDGEIVGDMSYREWEQWKKTGGLPRLRINGVTGQDITATWQRRPDEYAFEIEDVIAAQGFDGLPTIVDAEEFVRMVKEANDGNGFIAQRSYSAPDQETLDAYRDQLYNGKWYVDCSTGGAQYGQGMYCAADYNGQLTDGIKAEMQHYRDQYMARFGYDLTPEQWLENSSAVLQKYGLDSSQYGEIARAYLDEDDKLFERLTHQLSASERDKLYDELYEVPHRGIHNYVETFTLDPSAKIVSWREINDIRTGTLGIEYRNEVLEEELKRRGLSGDELTFARYNAGLGVSWNDVDAAARRLGEEKRNAVMEQLEDAGNITQRRFNEEQERRKERARIYQEKYHDIGSLAAALGYDAINAENHGQSGSYTVILNRTKVIIRRPT